VTARRNTIDFTLIADDDFINATEDVRIDVYMDAASTVDVGAFEARLIVTGATGGVCGRSRGGL